MSRPGVRSFRPGKSRPSNKRGAYIHPSKFVNKATVTAEDAPYQSTHRFIDFNLTPLLQKNVDHKG